MDNNENKNLNAAPQDISAEPQDNAAPQESAANESSVETVAADTESAKKHMGCPKGSKNGVRAAKAAEGKKSAKRGRKNAAAADTAKSGAADTSLTEVKITAKAANSAAKAPTRAKRAPKASAASHGEQYDAVRDAIDTKLSRYFGTTPEDASEGQMYKAVVLTVKDILTQKRGEYHDLMKKKHAKRVYYMCMEFLVGRSLRNNIMNLGMLEPYRDVLSDMGFSLDKLYEREPDPGLGNGGLGRLASCFMDSLTSLDYVANGFSLCYEYGLFRQRIIDGIQLELPDIWMPEGDVWLVPRADKTFTVRLGGHITEKWHDGRLDITHEGYEEVQAVPYDMMISGADCEAVNVLRLWKSQNVPQFNMSLFSQGQYVKALEESTNAEVISKVLYPSDNHTEGKLLRLTQQYFLVSASLQCIIADHLAAYGTLTNFTDKVAIHLNDTHPALCIPELMRILLDVYSYSWEHAWDVCRHVFSYTNHTVLPEA
ncbi:MAG: glycogen/starch/alpha-glucan phosphorylase, partial [Eubacteriales bacterium]